MMRGYAETTDCRCRNVLGYFGENRTEPCGNCDRCDEGASWRSTSSRDADILAVGE